MIRERETLTFRFPMPLNLANSRLHWRVKDTARRSFYAHCDVLLAGDVFAPPPANPWERAEISSTMTLGNAMDDGNAMNRHKWVEDWLRDRGYIVDDSKKHLKWTALPTQRVSRKNDPCIVITLTRAK